MENTVLIVDDMHESIIVDLKSLGYDVHYLPDISRKELSTIIYDYTGIIIRSKTNLDRELLAMAKKLRFVARAGAGVENIDERYCQRKGISVLNAPEANRDALGEHVIGMLLCLLNHIHTSDREVREGLWDRYSNRGLELSGRTVGIIGYGHMGSAFARRLQGFDCRVLAYDKYKKGFSDSWVEEATMGRIFGETDILSLHVPLTDETRGYYNREYFEKFGKRIVVINSARGQILPLKDLLSLMDQGKILGAALDVLENERPESFNTDEKEVFSDLVSRKNVVLTPHTGGWTVESYGKINEVLITKIRSLSLKQS